MEVTPKNIDYQEFLSIISGIKKIKAHTIIINYNDEVIGTLEQLNELAKEIESLDFKRFIYELNEEANKVISDVEIKKYLKELTDNFDVDLTKTALIELEVFESMEFDEVVTKAAVDKYIAEGWDIPEYEKKCPITKEVHKFYNYKEIINKAFPFLGMQLYLAKSYLQQALPPQQNDKPKPKLKIDQIALKYAYEGLQITRKNSNEIAKKYGHNSGEKLFQRFTYFSSPANRKGKPNLCTPKKLDNKIKLFESIIELLPTDKQERAKYEVSILKKIYEAEYQ